MINRTQNNYNVVVKDTVIKLSKDEFSLDETLRQGLDAYY